MSYKKYPQKIPSYITKLILLCCWIFCGNIGAQIPIFTASQQFAANGDLVTVDIKVQNFTNIGAFQFTMNWDNQVLQYQNTANYGFLGYSATNFGQFGIQEGILTTVWFDLALVGESLPDNSILFSIIFEVLGEEGDSSLLEFVDAPTAIYVAMLDGTTIVETPATFETGEVEVISTQIDLSGQTTDNQCFGQSIGSIDLTIQGGLPSYQIEWTGPNNFTSNETNIDNLPPGIYTVTVTDDFGTTMTETFEITAPATPMSIQNITTQQTNCNAQTGEIEVVIAGGTMPYNYDFGQGFSGNNLAQNLPSGEYSISILDANDCPLNALATIEQAIPNLITLGQDTAICTNETLVLSIENTNGMVTWFQDGNDLGNATNALEIFETGTYSVELTDEFGCVSTDTVEVELKELEISISPDTTIFRGMSVSLFVSGGETYLWQPADFLSCQTCPNPIAQPTTDTYFIVSISTANGCFATDSVFVDISNDLELVIDPINFFSPNDDGKNDRLIFAGLEMFPKNSLIIYNRWGNKIYNSLNYQQNGNFWDGKLNGQELPAGVYYYILKVDANGTEIRSSLTLTR